MGLRDFLRCMPWICRENLVDGKNFVYGLMLFTKRSYRHADVMKANFIHGPHEFYNSRRWSSGRFLCTSMSSLTLRLWSLKRFRPKVVDSTRAENLVQGESLEEKRGKDK